MPDRSVIHKWAAAAAATAAALPVGADALCLASEEALLVVRIAAMFGQQITKEVAAQALTTGAFGTIAGTAVFEGLNIGYPLTIPAKIAAAVVVVEALGNATYEFYNSGGRL